MYRSEIDNEIVELFVHLIQYRWRQESDIPKQIKWRVLEILEKQKFGHSPVTGA